MSTHEEIERYNQHIATVERSRNKNEVQCLALITEINNLQAQESALRVQMSQLVKSRQDLETKLRDALVKYARNGGIHCKNGAIVHWAIVLRHALPVAEFMALTFNSLNPNKKEK